MKDVTKTTWNELSALCGIPCPTLRSLASKPPDKLRGTSLHTVLTLEKKLNVNLYEYVKYNQVR